MNKKTYIVGDSMISSLGFGSKENMKSLYAGKSGVQKIDDTHLYPESFMGARLDDKQLNRCFSSLLEMSRLPKEFEFTRFEKMAIMSMAGVYRDQAFPTDKNTLFILSTTKGNIDLLQDELMEKWGKERSMLYKAADVIAKFWGFENKARVLSNACISGIEALHIASKFIKQGVYENVIIVGADMLTEFVVSGFMSFQSLSPNICKPFDESRDGLNLGEAAGCIFLSSNEKYLKTNKAVLEITGGGVSNDANHISGPSRTGDGQFFAIQSAMKEAEMTSQDIDHISAHGTATPFNDEMESKALNLAGLQEKPVNSLKAYFGHTLGAAGVIESIVAIHNLIDQKILKSLGFEKHGVPMPLHISQETQEYSMNNILKTASGFGGCNAAVIISKTQKA